MRLGNRRAQFRARDVRVSFERGHSAIGPIGHCLSRVVRPRELVNVQAWSVACAIEIRAGYVEMRTGNRACLNQLTQSQEIGRAHV